MAIFSGTFSAVAVTAAQDCFEIVAPSNKRVVVHEIHITQYSDAGDAQAELLSVLLMRGHTTAGTGGSTVTPSNLSGLTGADTITTTVKANNTTVATGGSPVTLVASAWNVQAPWIWAPISNIMLEASQRFVVRITAPADSLTMNGTIICEEI